MKNRNALYPLIGLVLMAIAAVASGPDDLSDIDPYQDISYKDNPLFYKSADDVSDKKYFARCLYRNHVDGAIYILEVKRIRMVGGKEIEQNSHEQVRLKGVYAPRASNFRHRARPHIEVEREQQRFSMLEEQTWRLFQSSETLILSEMELDPQDATRYVAKIEYRIGAVDRNLAADLIADGYLVDDVYARDLGRRLP